MEKKFNNPRKDDYRDEVIDIRRVTKVTKVVVLYTFLQQ